MQISSAVNSFECSSLKKKQYCQLMNSNKLMLLHNQSAGNAGETQSCSSSILQSTVMQQ
jgi:hypothetical protein